MLRLHDTVLGRVVELTPRREGEVSIYVCGPTVYDVPHIGHGRSVLVYDVLRRYLEWCGYSVRHVSNVTDVDDQIIARAAQEGREPSAVARTYEDAWWDAVDRLGALRPTDEPHATAYVGRMVELVGELIDRGVAYVAEDGVYLSVEQVDGYGLLAQQTLESLRSGARVEPGAAKRAPLDFVLWKRSRPEEMPRWPSPWGEGRPGWHTECVVMSLDLLGEDFDLHAGGMDLQFPHHENERAQAVALGRRFARHWMHHAFVVNKGEKMSKSLGNFTSLSDLLSRTDPRAYRLLVLRSHYRSPLEVTPDTIRQAEHALERLDALIRRQSPAGASPDPGALARFRDAMDDDLDTPRAVADLFDLVRRANSSLDDADLERSAPIVAAVRVVAEAVGLVLSAHDRADDLDSATIELVRRRDEARAGREWATADALRAELEASGWVVEDTATGTVVRRPPRC
ncbi:MAG: cysteine--tRNA ligase [Acidimicrobiales bacterium]